MEVQKPQTVQITFNNKTITLHNVTIVDADPNRIIINRQFAPVNNTSVISNNTQNVPISTSKISRHKSPTSSPIAKKKFNGTQNQSDLDLSFQCMFCDDIHEELDHLISHMRSQHPDLINLPDEGEAVDNIEDINKNTHSTTNSVGEDDFDEYIEEEEEEQFVLIKDEGTGSLNFDETESTIEYDESSCSSSRPPSSPPSPEYEEHISFSRLQEIQREMNMHQEEELGERKKSQDSILLNNAKMETKSNSLNQKLEEKNILNSLENEKLNHIGTTFEDHENPSIIFSKASDQKSLGIPEDSRVSNSDSPKKSQNLIEKNFQRKSTFMDSFHDYEGIFKYADSTIYSSDEVQNTEIDHSLKYSPEHNNQQELDVNLKITETNLSKFENQEQYFSNFENLRRHQEIYAPEVCNEESNDKTEHNDQYENNGDDENGMEHFEYPEHYAGFTEENGPDSSENYDSDHSTSFDYFDQELLNILEPICELKSEEDEKSNLNQEAMELYRMAMELNYLENGIKKRGKRKNMPAIDENSSESVNDKNINTSDMQPNIIKLPQGPGRGRRREIDEAEMELINSGPNCFFQCNLCDKSYKYAGDLAKHVRSHTLNRPYQCSICDKSFTHIGSLNTHLRIHSGERPYKCNFSNCDKSFTQSNSLMVHMKSHLSNKPYQCDICNKGFLNASSLAMHQKTHTDNEPITCPQCFKEFKHANLLSEHMQIHKQSMLYQCSLCRKQFEQACLLVQHMKSHTGDKPFRCEICHKSFTQPGSLNTHLRIHTGEKPFKCQHCEKSFTQASSLSVHVKVHLGEKQYKCKYCLKDYSQHSYLQKHIQQMHLSRNDVPKINDEGYAVKSSVIQTNQQYNSNQSQQKSQSHHIKQSFQNTTDFDCPLCSLKCANTSDLILHLRVHCDLN